MSPRQQKRSVIEERWRRTFAISRRCSAAVSPRSKPQPSPFWHQTMRASSLGRSSTAAAANPDIGTTDTTDPTSLLDNRRCYTCIANGGYKMLALRSRDRAAARCSRQEDWPQQELLCVRGHLAPDRGHGGLLPGASASSARRGARDTRNSGAAAQETHQAVTTAPVWKIGGTVSDPFKLVEAGD